MLGAFEKGCADVDFTARGKGGHASAPPKDAPIDRLSAFVKEQIAENGDALPEWLDGLVSVFEKTSVGVRKAAR